MNDTLSKSHNNRSAVEFYNAIVLPCIEKWQTSHERKNQEWLIRAAVNFLNDLIEYNARDKGIKATEHRKNLKNILPLRIIIDIANGSKHVSLTRGEFLVEDSSSAYLDNTIDSYGYIDDVPDFDNHAVFKVTLDDGSEYDVDDLIKHAQIYWQHALRVTDE